MDSIQEDFYFLISLYRFKGLTYDIIDAGYKKAIQKQKQKEKSSTE